MRLIGRLFDVVARVVGGTTDPWERLAGQAPVGAFGPGAQREFAWYLAGESTVRVQSGSDVRDWLLGCEYVRDEHQFAEGDVWQHPCDFERGRRGDCEDYALWAWRKFLELGYEAELVVGRCAGVEADGRHAWVVVRLGTERYLVEATARGPDGMIRPLAQVRAEYVPECGVGADLRPFLYGGSRLSVKGSSRRSALGSRLLQEEQGDVPRAEAAPNHRPSRAPSAERRAPSAERREPPSGDPP